MSLQEDVRTAIVAELSRQAEARGTELRVEADQAGDSLKIDGLVDIASLAEALVGAVAGGP